MQADAITLVENVPAMHERQPVASPKPAEFEKYPAPQGRQNFAKLCPIADEYVPTPHVAQTVAPTTEEYVPASHGVQRDEPEEEE